MKLQSITLASVPHLANQTVELGSGFHVVVVPRDVGGAAMAHLIAAVASVGEPAAGDDWERGAAAAFSGLGAHPGADRRSVAVVLERSDGTRLRAERSLAEIPPAPAAPTFAADLNDAEATELATLAARLRGLDAASALRLTDGQALASARDGWPLGWPHVLVALATGTAIGAFLWPVLPALAVAVGAIVVGAVFLFFVVHARRQAVLSVKRQLHLRGVDAGNELPGLVARRDELARRQAGARAAQQLDPSLQPLLVAAIADVGAQPDVLLFLAEASTKGTREQPDTWIDSVARLPRDRPVLVFTAQAQIGALLLGRDARFQRVALEPSDPGDDGARSG